MIDAHLETSHDLRTAIHQICASGFANRSGLPRAKAAAPRRAALSAAEGWGLTLMEAMACGLAPVTTPVGGAPEVVRHGETGWLVAIGTCPASVAAVRALGADRRRLLEVRTAAQRAVRDQTWRTVASRTLSMYQAVLSAGSRREASAGTGPAARARR